MIFESALLPKLENDLRGFSITNIEQSLELFSTYGKFCEAMARHKCLLPAFLGLGPEYQPPQKDSVLSLMTLVVEKAEKFVTNMS